MADRIPYALPIKAQPATATATATPGNVLGDPARTRYGRLQNPEVGVTAGEWVSVQSTFLAAVRFVPYAQAEDEEPTPQDQVTGDLYLEFNSGAICKWAGRTYQNYRDYLNAPSKGVFHRSTPWYHGPYEVVREATRSGAALAARVKANG